MNGFVQYPKGFLKEAFELVRERGGVCIADEVSSNGRVQFSVVGSGWHRNIPFVIFQMENSECLNSEMGP